MKKVLTLCLFLLITKTHAISNLVIKTEKSVPEADTYDLDTAIYVPQGYSANNPAPVIVFLDTAEFYEQDLDSDAVNVISRLIQYQTIPNSILITVTPKSSYTATVTSPENLTSFLTKKLPKYIDQEFSNHNKIILSGFSYGAGYILREKELKKTYSSFLPVSPVFSSLEAAKQASSLLSEVETVIYYGDEDSSFVNILELSTPKKKNYYRENLAFENHQSVFQPGFSLGLKRLFSSFSFPHYQASIHNDWSVEELKQVVENIAESRGLTAQEAQKKVAETTLMFAKSYTQQNKVLLATQYWQEVTNKHKWLHLYQSLEILEQLHDDKLSRSFINALLENNLAPPLLKFLLDKNVTKDSYSQILKTSLANNKGKYSENDLNFLGYHLMNQKRIDLAVLAFKEAIVHFPDSLNLLDSLSDALIASCNIKEAKQVLNKALSSTSNERFKEHVKRKIQNIKPCDI